MNTLLGLALAGFGAYNIYTYTGDLTIPFWLKYGGMVLGGGVISLYNLFPTLLSYAKNIKLPQNKTNIVEKEETMANQLSKDILIQDEQSQDTQCLFYLTERLKGMPEGVELCKKLNTLIFDLHHPVKQG